MDSQTVIIYLAAAAVALTVFYLVIRSAVSAGTKPLRERLDQVAHTLSIQLKTQGVENLPMLIKEERAAELDRKYKGVWHADTLKEKKAEIMAE